MIYILRHGQTKSNRLKIVQGQSNEILDELGQKQVIIFFFLNLNIKACAVGKKLENILFDYGFCSDLPRTKQVFYFLMFYDFLRLWMQLFLKQKNHLKLFTLPYYVRLVFLFYF
jgi:bisphosphoglycerate-dependent phosphoglycerate mutase